MADSTLYIQSLKKYEGGLSNTLSDNASRNPSPCAVGNMKNIHTNKGITWSTFKRVAPKFGYKVDCDTFIRMPDDLWNKIYKNEYWDLVGGDDIKSQAIAELMADKAFNGYSLKDIQDYITKRGYPASTLKQRVTALNALTKINEKRLYDDLIEIRRQYYLSLNQPKNIEGWLNRLDKIADRGMQIIQEAASKSYVSFTSVLPTLVAGFIIGIGVYVSLQIERE